MPKRIRRRYITPQIAKVRPEGTKRLGYASESSPVYFPFNGKAFARKLTKMVTKTANKLRICIIDLLLGLVISFLQSRKI